MPTVIPLYRGAVLPSADLRRVRDLPRRDWKAEASDPEAVSEMFRSGLRGMTLKPIQAAALEELHDTGGLLAAVAVGGGKTLISFLAPAVLGAKRPVLVVPAALRDKTLKDFDILRKHWAEVPITIISYERLAQVNQAHWLTGIRPDLLILDECHKVKDPKTAACRRIHRYLKANPDTAVCAMSGTITDKSIKDFAHISAWALGEGSPLPLERGTIEEWSMALDSRDPYQARRLEPGALAELGPGPVREVLGLRVAETPGVIVSAGRDVHASLILERFILDVPCPELDSAFSVLRKQWRTPDEREIIDGLDMAASARELGLGFFLAWDPLPPVWWLQPRAEWAKHVRDVIQSNRRGLDTELQVRQAVEAGEYRGADALDAWDAVREQFTPNVVERWITPKVIERVAEIAGHGAQLIWTHHRAVGRALSELMGVPLYAEGGHCERTGGHIDQHEDGPAVCTIASNATGRNLQRFNRSLVVEPPANGKTWEQLIGRTHRAGQEADEVWIGWTAGCLEHLAAVEKATEDARYATPITRQEQRLCYADRVETGGPGRGPRWTK